MTYSIRITFIALFKIALNLSPCQNSWVLYPAVSVKQLITQYILYSIGIDYITYSLYVHTSVPHLQPN